MKFLGFFLVLNFFSFYQAEETRVELVQIVFRHGARTPVVTYPKDPYQESKWSQYGGFGQLTQKGMNQHYEYGKFLRQRYTDFLNKTYSRERVLAISTDYDRTLMSAYSLLASLYEPEGDQLWNKNLTWQPIPVHIGDPKLFLVQETCARYNKLASQVTETAEYIDVTKQYKDVIDVAGKNSGFTEVDLMSLWKIADAVIIEKSFNLELPDWVQKYYNEIVRSQDYGFYFDYYYPEMAKLAAGGLINEIRNNIDLKIKGNSTRQLHLFSSHDTYVASITKLLNLTSRITQPPFASSVIVELRKSVTSSKYFVQVYLKNNTEDEPIEFREMTIYGCDKLCPLEDFLHITSSMIITDYGKECSITTDIELSRILNPTFIIVVAFAAILAVVVSVFMIISFRNTMRRSGYRSQDL